MVNMHTLAVFPRLLDYVLLAPLLLRVAVGVLRFFAGLVRYKKEYKWLAILYIVSSVLIIIGLYTQIASLAAILLILFDYYMEKKAGTLSREKNALTILMTVILVSLIFTGPGAFAFDLPL